MAPLAFGGIAVIGLLGTYPQTGKQIIQSDNMVINPLEL